MPVLFWQLVELQNIPDGVSQVVLKHGIEVQLPEVPGSPTIECGKVIDPLTQPQYKIRFIGEEGEEKESTMHLGRKIWFHGDLHKK